MSDVGRYRKILALYLLTGPQTNRIGLYMLSVATAAEDLGTVPQTLHETFVEGLRQRLQDQKQKTSSRTARPPCPEKGKEEGGNEKENGNRASSPSLQLVGTLSHIVRRACIAAVERHKREEARDDAR